METDAAQQRVKYQLGADYRRVGGWLLVFCLSLFLFSPLLNFIAIIGAIILIAVVRALSGGRTTL